MSFFSWFEKRIRLFHWFDISLIKLSSAAFALMVAKLWPPLLSLDWQVYFLITVLAAAPVCLKIFRKA